MFLGELEGGGKQARPFQSESEVQPSSDTFQASQPSHQRRSVTRKRLATRMQQGRASGQTPNGLSPMEQPLKQKKRDLSELLKSQDWDGIGRYPGYSVVGTTEHFHYLTCYNYALGLETNRENRVSVTRILEDPRQFREVSLEATEAGDIVAYFDTIGVKTKDGQIIKEPGLEHIARAINNKMSTSKFGSFGYVYQHPHLEVPYGDTVKVFRKQSNL